MKEIRRATEPFSAVPGKAFVMTVLALDPVLSWYVSEVKSKVIGLGSESHSLALLDLNRLHNISELDFLH